MAPLDARLYEQSDFPDCLAILREAELLPGGPTGADFARRVFAASTATVVGIDADGRVVGLVSSFRRTPSDLWGAQLAIKRSFPQRGRLLLLMWRTLQRVASSLHCQTITTKIRATSASRITRLYSRLGFSALSADIYTTYMPEVARHAEALGLPILPPMPRIERVGNVVTYELAGLSLTFGLPALHHDKVRCLLRKSSPEIRTLETALPKPSGLNHVEIIHDTGWLFLFRTLVISPPWVSPVSTKDIDVPAFEEAVVKKALGRRNAIDVLYDLPERRTAVITIEQTGERGLILSARTDPPFARLALWSFSPVSTDSGHLVLGAVRVQLRGGRLAERSTSVVGLSQVLVNFESDMLRLFFAEEAAS